MMLILLALLFAADGGTSVPPMLKRPVTYRFVSWEPGGVPEQLTAPCPNVAAIHEVEGKCWGRTMDRSPCPAGTWQYSVTCYIPVIEDKTVPIS